MNSYDRLRSIGVSVETADALSLVIDGLSLKKREAFFLWAIGYNITDASNKCGLKRETFRDSLKYIRQKINATGYISIDG